MDIPPSINITADSERLSSRVQKRTITSSEDETQGVLTTKKAKFDHEVSNKQFEKERKAVIEKKPDESNEMGGSPREDSKLIASIQPIPSVLRRSEREEERQTIPSQTAKSSISQSLEISTHDDRSKLLKYMRILWQHVELFEA
eukprot:jgi/Psemu1/51124/gm1.51124_g